MSCKKKIPLKFKAVVKPVAKVVGEIGKVGPRLTKKAISSMSPGTVPSATFSPRPATSAPPPPPPMPIMPASQVIVEPVKAVDEVSDLAEKERNKRRRGRSSTILTGGLGLSGADSQSSTTRLLS